MDTLLACLYTLLAGLIIYMLQQRRRSVSRSLSNSEPPQADGAWPLIGHLHLLGSKQLTHMTLGTMADKYGPVFTIKLGSHKALVVSSPEMAEECFTLHDKAFADRPRSEALEIMTFDYAMFGFASFGPYWREMLKIVSMELLSKRRLDTLKHVRFQEVRISIGELHGEWIKHNCPENGVLVEMKKWFGDLTHNITLRMVSGKRYFGANADCEGEETRVWQKVTSDFFHLSGVIIPSDVIPYVGWLDLGGYKKAMKKAAKEMDMFMDRWLEEHKQRRFSSETEEEKDFMDVMLNVLKDSKISGFDADTINKATCLNMVIGGTDTLMVTLTWVLSLILNNKNVLQNLQAELDTKVGKERHVDESDITNLVYLQAVVKETFRLYPAAPVIPFHLSTEQITLSNGYQIPAGTRLMTNIWRIQRDENVWHEPLQFRPERFLTNNKDIDVRGRNFELIPFGSGRRSCPGASMALQVVHLVLASLLQSYEVATPSDKPVDMSESTGLLNLKATPLEVRLTPRLNLKLY